jgi:hypothetical protein
MPSVSLRSVTCFSLRPMRTAFAAVALADGGRVALHGGGALLALLAGVVLIGLITGRSTRFCRSVMLLAAGLLLCCGFFLLYAGPTYGAILPVAAAMGAAQCVFEQDASQLRDALLPSVQAVRLGEALAAGRLRETRRPLRSDSLSSPAGRLVPAPDTGPGAGPGAGGWLRLLRGDRRPPNRERSIGRRTVQPQWSMMTSDNEYVDD